MQKIETVEEQKKISIVGYIDKLEKIQITENVLDEIRNNLTAQLNTVIVPLGQDVSLIMETITEINDIINDEVWDDIYDDNVTLLFKNYIKFTRNYDMKKEMVIKLLSESLIKILDKITDLGINPKHIPYEDDGSLTEDERQSLRDRSIRLILQYKKFKNKGSSIYSKAYSLKIYNLADTQAKFELLNNLFFEHTGEYVLDMIRKEKEKLQEQDKIKQKEKEV